MRDSEAMMPVKRSILADRHAETLCVFMESAESYGSMTDEWFRPAELQYQMLPKRGIEIWHLGSRSPKEEHQPSELECCGIRILRDTFKRQCRGSGARICEFGFTCDVIEPFASPPSRGTFLTIWPLLIAFHFPDSGASKLASMQDSQNLG